MAQILKPNRLDNRGGHKPKTSTKKMFTYRVEPQHHEMLKEICVYLNSKKIERCLN
jgi:hypothetical protein